MEQVEIFDIRIDNVTMREAVDRIRSMVKERKNAYVLTPNVDHIVKLGSDPEFLELYQKADFVIPDGKPLVWASRLLKKGLKERVTGADLFIELCADAEKTGMSVFLLGSASQEIIDRTSARLCEMFPRLKVAGAYSPSFGFEKRQEENEMIVGMVRKAGPDILFVGVGAPKQEKWIYHYRSRLGVPVSLGVGASFDFVAGSVKRAPLWMQKSGLEWFYRVTQEPKRMFKRYFIDDFAFFPLVLREWKRQRRDRAKR